MFYLLPPDTGTLEFDKDIVSSSLLILPQVNQAVTNDYTCLEAAPYKILVMCGEEALDATCDLAEIWTHGNI